MAVPGGWELVLILAVLLVMFPATMPKAARSVGQSLRILKDTQKDLAEDSDRPTRPTGS